MPQHKPELFKEGVGKDKVTLSTWFRTTRSYLECTMADNTDTPLWSVMLMAPGANYTAAQNLRDNNCKNVITSSLSPAMCSTVENLPRAADMWRRLNEVFLVHERGCGTLMTLAEVMREVEGPS
jgi:hypothetical protein